MEIIKEINIKRSKGLVRRFQVRCVCGKEFTLPSSRLNKTKSCGCLNNNKKIKKNKKAKIEKSLLNFDNSVSSKKYYLQTK